MPPFTVTSEGQVMGLHPCRARPGDPREPRALLVRGGFFLSFFFFLCPLLSVASPLLAFPRSSIPSCSLLSAPAPVSAVISPLSPVLSAPALISRAFPSAALLPASLTLSCSPPLLLRLFLFPPGGPCLRLRPSFRWLRAVEGSLQQGVRSALGESQTPRSEIRFSCPFF